MKESPALTDPPTPTPWRPASYSDPNPFDTDQSVPAVAWSRVVYHTHDGLTWPIRQWRFGEAHPDGSHAE